MAHCGGYRLEHVRRLTIHQFRLLVNQGDLFEEKQKLILAEAMRVAYHADKRGFTEWLSAKMNRFKKPKKEKAVTASDEMLSSMGIDKR